MISSAAGTVAAFMPHVLHHAGLIVGAAFLSGVVGGALFALLGLIAVVPIVLRLRRRTGSWRAPAIALAAFAVMFTVITAMTHSM